MPQIFIKPDPADDVTVGTMVDADGERLVGLRFRAAGDQEVILAFTAARLVAFAKLMQDAVGMIGDER